MIQNERKNTVLYILYIISGIWILFWGYPALFFIQHFPNISIFYEGYILLFFHIILPLFLFAGAYYLYKKNEKFIIIISKALIITSLIYLLIYNRALIIYMVLHLSLDELFNDIANVGMYLVIYTIPVLLPSTLAILHIKKNIQFTLLLAAGMFQFLLFLFVFLIFYI